MRRCVGTTRFLHVSSLVTIEGLNSAGFILECAWRVPQYGCVAVRTDIYKIELRWPLCVLTSVSLLCRSSSIGGGYLNAVLGRYGAVAGGSRNTVNGRSSTVMGACPCGFCLGPSRTRGA